MKKQYIFTKDSSFTHVKDKMHQEVTEHIIQDDETKKLYHHVVSYGSWFRISYSSIFMSHLLRKIGVTGFGLAYATDDSQIILPCYPYHKPETKSVVELPKGIELKDIEFGHSKCELSDKFKQTFVGKTFKKSFKSGGTYETKGKDLLEYLFGCSAFCFGEAKIEDKVYPLYCILYGLSCHKVKDLSKILEDTDIGEYAEIRHILEEFATIDIEKTIKIFEEEVQTEMSKLCADLIDRQEMIKRYLRFQQQMDITQ